jgi:hypothetical protein
MERDRELRLSIVNDFCGAANFEQKNTECRMMKGEEKGTTEAERHSDAQSYFLQRSHEVTKKHKGVKS